MTARTVAVLSVQARMGSMRLPGYEALGRDDLTWREALAVVEAEPVVVIHQSRGRSELVSAGELRH